MNTPMYPLNLVSWHGLQVIEHAKALVGTVNTASFNSTADQSGATEDFHMIFSS